MYVLVITRKLPLPEVDGVVSMVKQLDSWVDPHDCDSWIEDNVNSHKEDFSKQFLEFKHATFEGSVHRVLKSFS